MLDSEDIQKLREVLPSREDMPSKDELGIVKDDINCLCDTVDAYAKKADIYLQEIVMHRIKNR